jgi:hypothetical protein
MARIIPVPGEQAAIIGEKIAPPHVKKAGKFPAFDGITRLYGVISRAPGPREKLGA